jgi:hypothetical protein
MSKHDRIPTVGVYRGVNLHDQQSEERLAVVRTAIDRVFDQTDPLELAEIAFNPAWPPEARLFAAAKLEALMEIAADERAVRPKIDLARVRAGVAGVDSKTWRNPTHYGSLLDHGRFGSEEVAVKRETPIQRD